MAESIARARIELINRPSVTQDPYMLGLLQADITRQDCMLLTQHLMGIALYAYTPQHKAHYMANHPSDIRRL